MEPFFQGLVLQSSLILALGAQNLFVLDCGIRKRHPVVVALISACCDLFLVVLGVFGAAALFQAVPLFRPVLGVIGVLFLIYYGVIKIKEASRPTALNMTASGAAGSLRATMIAAVSFSLLNPHVYLDTVVLIGGYSLRFAAASDRLLFGTGAASFSFLWFFSLSLGAAAVSSRLSSPRVLHRVSLASGIVLIVLGLKLGWEFRAWF